MDTTLTVKGQVTIPQRIRQQLGLEPGAAVRFEVNDGGELVIRRAATAPDRFDAVRGSADVPWRTDELMALLRAE
jgi:antitoxin PrlF